MRVEIGKRGERELNEDLHRAGVRRTIRRRIDSAEEEAGETRITYFGELHSPNHALPRSD